jgi:hypothetical protein
MQTVKLYELLVLEFKQEHELELYHQLVELGVLLLLLHQLEELGVLLLLLRLFGALLEV